MGNFRVLNTGREAFFIVWSLIQSWPFLILFLFFLLIWPTIVLGTLIIWRSVCPGTKYSVTDYRTLMAYTVMLTSASSPSPIAFESFPNPLTCIFILPLYIFYFNIFFSSKLFYSLPGIYFSLVLSVFFFSPPLYSGYFFFLVPLRYTITMYFWIWRFFLLWCFFTNCSNYIWIDSANLQM